jgi:hypothetical protein
MDTYTRIYEAMMNILKLLKSNQFSAGIYQFSRLEIIVMLVLSAILGFLLGSFITYLFMRPKSIDQPKKVETKKVKQPKENKEVVTESQKTKKEDKNISEIPKVEKKEDSEKESKNGFTNIEKPKVDLKKEFKMEKEKEKKENVEKVKMVEEEDWIVAKKGKTKPK